MDDPTSFTNAPAGHPASSPIPAFAAQATMPAGAAPPISRIRRYFAVVADYGSDDPTDLIEVVLAEPLSEAQIGALLTGLPASTIEQLGPVARHRLFELIGQGVDVAVAQQAASDIAEMRPN